MLSTNNNSFNGNRNMSAAPTNPILRNTLNLEQNRLQTFTKWTKRDISIHELAKFGWYFTGKLDIVKCNFCDAEKRDWIIGDHPLTLHVQISPGCPLLTRQSQNIPVNQQQLDELLPPISSIVKLSNGKQIIKLIGADVVLHPEFRSYIKRVQTFSEWPKSLRPTPHELSDAGFFYLGRGDHVKCFCCSGIIENWDSDWDVWEQHVHRFEDCQYVQLCKSPEFIEDVRAKFSGKSRQLNPSGSNQNDIERGTTREGENDNPKRSNRLSLRTCNLCFKEEINSIFIPCMHIYACTKCGFSETHCPVCQQKISEVKRCYIF